VSSKSNMLVAFDFRLIEPIVWSEVARAWAQVQDGQTTTSSELSHFCSPLKSAPEARNSYAGLEFLNSSAFLAGSGFSRNRRFKYIFSHASWYIVGGWTEVQLIGRHVSRVCCGSESSWSVGRASHPSFHPQKHQSGSPLNIAKVILS
jgi:hypothetical protein